MNKKGKIFEKGTRRSRVLAIALILAVIVGCWAAITSLAENSVPTGTFDVAVPSDLEPEEDGAYTYYDWSKIFSTTDTVNITGSNVFVVQQTTGLKKIQLLFSNSYCPDLKNTTGATTSAATVKINGMKNGQPTNPAVKVSERNGGVTVTFTSSSAITVSEANDFLSGITVSFNKNSGLPNGSTTVSLTGYNDEEGGASTEDNKYLIGMKGYSCKLLFYNYAEGTIDASTLVVKYANESPDFKVVAPEDRDLGEASFMVEIQPGDVGVEGLEEVAVGYAQKLSTETWSSENEGVKQGTTPVQLTEEQIAEMQDNGSVRVKVTATGLNANTDYDIKALVITGGKVDSPKATAQITARYIKPMFSSFSVSGANAPALGGQNERKEITAEVDFLNENYDGKNTDIPLGSDEPTETIDKAKLKLTLYFTDNFLQEDGEDKSTWTQIGEPQYAYLPDASGSRRASWKNADASLAAEGHPFYHYLAKGEGGSAVAIDSKHCAYRLVATDEATGFSTYSYTTEFVVDSSYPSAPEIVSPTDGQVGGISTNDLINTGSAVSGGEITLNIGKASDATTSVKSYSYSYYYLDSSLTTAFVEKYYPSHTGTITPELVVRVLREEVLKYFNMDTDGQLKQADTYFTGDGMVEYTDWSALPNPETENDYTSQSFAKDGFYVVLARSSDEVGLVSAPSAAMFRIDTSAPNPPEVRMAIVKSGETASGLTAANTATKLTAYDGRYYSPDEVYIFAKAIPQTGKTIDLTKYQYSLDGGKSWNNVDEETTKIINTAGTGKLTQVYNPWDYSAAKADFVYDVGFKLPDAGVTGYQTIIFKAEDTLQNVSLPCEPVKRRQEKNSIGTTGSMDLTNLEIALALGNTDVDVDSIPAALKNKVAQKVNEQFFGKDSAQVNALKSGGKYHECTFASSADVCDFAASGNCPYESDTVTYFKPNMVNVQGISGASAGGGSNFSWTRYDHTMHKSTESGGYATVYFDSQYNYMTKSGETEYEVKVMHTSIGPDPTIKSTYKVAVDANKDGVPDTDAKGNVIYETRYTGTKDYVVSTGQTAQATSLADMDTKYTASKSYNTISNQNNRRSGDYAIHNWRDWQSTDNIDGNGNTIDPESWKETSLTSVGKYVTGSATSGRDNKKPSSAAFRIYHMVDMSNATVCNDGPGTIRRNWGANSNTSTKYLQGDMSDKTKLDMSTIYGLGYWYGTVRDWMFMYYDQPTAKTISFTIDDRNVFPHSNDFYGFLFNTTIRQNKYGAWVMSGYMFAAGSVTTMSAGSAVSGSNPYYYWYILKLTDVNLDWFSNATLTSNGEYGPTSPVDHRAQTEVDELIGRMIGNNNRTWSNTTAWNPRDASGNVITEYDPVSKTVKPVAITSKIEVEAYTRKDANDALGVRNFRLEIASDFTAKLYVWNTGSVEKTIEQLTNQYKNVDNKLVAGSTTYVKDSVTHNSSTTATSAGYRAVAWYLADKTTAYNKAKDSKGNTLPSTVLYVPRPTVDGLVVGDLSELGEDDTVDDRPHTDSNCYGFGPITSARSWGHGCQDDSLVIFSNVSLEVNVAKKLSDVLSLPNWGAGKAFYVLNVSNDSVSDYTNPILSSKIKNRMSKDNTRLITLADIRNKKTTTDFNDTLGNDAMGNPKAFYQMCGSRDVDFDKQMENIADYITTTYFAEYGLKTSDDNVKGLTAQINNMAGVKGRVYSLEDAKKMSFGVTTNNPDVDYNVRTANEDYPAGRWYLYHDRTGYANAAANPLHEKYFDGLDLKITAPGRYSLYFAPDVDNLNPDDDNCIFDFIVNQAPQAQFVASLDSNTNTSEGGKISITDYSTDPDTGLTTNASQNKGTAATGTITYDNETRPATPSSEISGGQRQITGISAAHWSWEMKVQYVDPQTQAEESLTVATGNSTDYLAANPGRDKLNPYDGLTLKQLLQSGIFSRSVLAKLSKVVKSDGKTRKYVDPTGYTAPTNAATLEAQIADTTSAANSLKNCYYTALLPDSVVTFYETVEDVSTRRVRNSDGAWAFADPTIKGEKHSASKQAQQDMISSTMDITVAPSPLFTADITEVYDTNDASTTKVTFERTTISSDGKNFDMRFAMTINGEDKNLYGGNASAEIPATVPASNVSATLANGKPNPAYYRQLDFDATAEATQKKKDELLAADENADVSGVYERVYTNNIGDFTHWYLREADGSLVTNANGVAWPKTTAVLVPATTNPIAPSCTNGTAQGKWVMSKEFIDWATAGKADATVTLILYETTYGVPIGSSTNQIERVEDKKGVTINFRRDRIAPSSPTTDMDVYVQQSNGGWAKDLAGYNASGYLDTTIPLLNSNLAGGGKSTTVGSRSIRISVSGSQDNQGSVAGYGYYLYDYKTNSTEIDHIWALNTNASDPDNYGKRIEVTLTNEEKTGLTAAQQLRLKVRKAVGVDHYDLGVGRIIALTRDDEDPLKNSKGYFAESDADKYIAITANTFSEEKKDAKKPTDTINVAVFAFDAQYISDSTEQANLAIQSPDNVTFANETARAKLEGIQLAAFEPYPTAIRGVNGLGAVVASVDNEGVKTTPINANTNVTFTFTPKQGWYDIQGDNKNHPQYLPNHTGGAVKDKYAQYYMDRSGEADLTGKAQIEYVLYKYDPTSGITGYPDKYVPMNTAEFDFWDDAKRVETPKEIPATTPVVVNVDGQFKLKARVKNGSNAYSTWQEVSFEIDKTPPQLGKIILTDPSKSGSDKTYNPNEWARTIIMEIQTGTDNNPDTAKYVYSLDNGATLNESYGPVLMGLNNEVPKIDIAAELESLGRESTGTHTIRVYIEDQAGNRSTIWQSPVKIDRKPPIINPPTLTVGIDTTMAYKNQVVTINPTVNGTVYAWDGAQTDETNTDIVVTNGSHQQFKITPDEGYVLGSVSCRKSTWLDAPEGADPAEYENAHQLRLLSGDEVESYSDVTHENPGILSILSIEEDVTLNVAFVPDPARSSNPTPNAIQTFSYYSMPKNKPVLASNIAPAAAGDDLINVVISYDSDKGRASGPSDNKIAAGSTLNLSITPRTGYTLDKAEYSTDNSKWEDMTVAETGEGTNVWNASVPAQSASGTIYCRVTFKTLTSHELTLTVGEHGTLTGITGAAKKANTDNVYTFYEGAEITLYFSSDTSYRLGSVTVNGTTDTLESGANSYTIPGSFTTGPLTVNAGFVVDENAGTTYSIFLDYDATNLGFARIEPAGVFNATKNQYEVKVPAGGSWTFRIYPKPTYKATATRDWYDPVSRKLITGQAVTLAEQEDGAYTYTLSDVGNNFNTLHIDFEQKTYKVSWNVLSESTSSSEVGGALTYTYDGVSPGNTTNSVTLVEGGTVNFTATPTKGWVVKDVAISYDGGAYMSQGSRRNFSVRNVTQNTQVRVTFEERTFSSANSNLSITAQAVGISDGEQALDPVETYNFRLSKDGVVIAESGWKAVASHTFNGLEANQKYRVTVQAKDASGMPSTMSAVDLPMSNADVQKDSSEIYTLANVPTALSLDPIDEENVSNKTAVMGVDASGNPPETEYHVYYSRYSDMTARVDATLEYTDLSGVVHTGPWQPLDTMGQLRIKNLPAGQYLYMQVIARNADLVPTEANSRNIKGVQLSRAAPGENTMYFEEQAAPGQGVLLSWLADGSSSVRGYEIYRDGRLLTTTGPDVSSYLDPSATVGGDALYEYSYAIVSSTGASARSTAVSKTYYDAAKSIPAKKTVLDSLKTSTSAGDKVYQKAMTYPTYPTNTSRISAVPVGTGNTVYTGNARYRVISGGAERDQKYVVTLKAYYPADGEGGERTPLTDEQWYMDRYDYLAEGGVTAEEAADILAMATANGESFKKDNADVTTADALIKLLTPATVTEETTAARLLAGKMMVQKLIVETKSPDGGAVAEWKNLNINLEYRIVVISIHSTGKRVNGVDGYRGETAGIEGTYGKSMYVTKEGYGYTFANTSAKNLLGEVDKKWGEATFEQMEENGWTEAEMQKIIDMAGSDVSGTLGYTAGVVKAILQDDSATNDYKRVKTGAVSLLAEAERKRYTGDYDWGDPFGVYIAFNKSPNIKLADDYLAGNASNTNAKQITVNNKDGLMLNQSSNMRFNIGVKIWDEDGTLDSGGAYDVTGLLAGQTGRVTERLTSEYHQGEKGNVAIKESDATVHLINFDGSKFTSTGIYGVAAADELQPDNEKYPLHPEKLLELSVSDGGSKPSKWVELPIVINKTKPSIFAKYKSDGSAVVGAKKLENGRIYGLEADSSIVVSSTVEKPTTLSDADMRVIRLLAMENDYTEQFGVATVEGIQQKLTDGNATAVASAKKWMGEADYNAAAQGGWTTEETEALIDMVNPTVQAYFEITYDQYQEHEASGKVREALGKYWAEKEYAFTNDLSKFLKRIKEGADAGKIKVEADALINYSVLLVADFGGNETYANLSFRVEGKPHINVQSEKYWAWAEDVPYDEYRAYAEGGDSSGEPTTIEKYYNKYKQEYGVEPWSGLDPSAVENDPVFGKQTASYKQVGDKYSVFKLKDRKMDIGTNRIGMTLEISTGIYPRFTDLTAVFYEVPENGSEPTAPTSRADMNAHANEGKNRVQRLTEAVNNRTQGYTVTGLHQNTTYMMWLCYDVVDPETGETVFCCDEGTKRVTMENDYGAAYYSFETSTPPTIVEKEGELNIYKYLYFNVVRTFTTTKDSSYATLIPTMTYYYADENGNYTDKDGNPSETPVELNVVDREVAARTISLSTSEVVYTAADDTSPSLRPIQINWRNTNEKQGHLLIHVDLAIDPERAYKYNYLSDANNRLVIFMQDDESPITFYKGALDEGEHSHLTKIATPTGMKGTVYDYEFSDLEYPYSSGEMGALQLQLKNTLGSAALENIEATVYADDKGKPSNQESDKFMLSKLPSPGTLDPIVSAEDLTAMIRSEITVIPSTSLPDDVHTAWLKIQWDNMTEEDAIWIRLRQVVGQSTLQGYIYLTPNKPQANSTAFMGWSAVRVQSNNASIPFDRTVYTDEYGFFRIPNIINTCSYIITVTRPGFITYNVGGSRIWSINGDSATYDLSFQMVGGEIADNNNAVNGADLQQFGNYYNKVYDPISYDPENYIYDLDTFKRAYPDKVDADGNPIDGVQELPAEILELMKRDYNADGVINTFDRMTIYDNQGKNRTAYFTRDNMAVPKKVTTG